MTLNEQVKAVVDDETLEGIVRDEGSALNGFSMADRIEVVCRIISRRVAKRVRTLCEADAQRREEEAWNACLEWALNEAPNEAGLFRQASPGAFAAYRKGQEGDKT